MDKNICEGCSSLYHNEFQTFDEEAMVEFIKHHNENIIIDNYKAGEYLFRNGSPSYRTFCVCSGKIELIYKNEEEFFIKELKYPGEIIGEDNLDIHYFIYDAFALEDSQVCSFDKNYFKTVLQNSGL
jgi:CRP-like cAMP-binding protein